MAFQKKIKLAKFGDSFGCIIPIDWVRQHYGNEKGEFDHKGVTLVAEIDSDQIVLRPNVQTRKLPA